MKFAKPASPSFVRTLRPVALLVTATLLGALHLTTGAAEDTKTTSQPRPALSVQVVQPQQGQQAVTLAANGSIHAWQEALVGSESSGLRLEQVLVNVGDQVRKGQLLASFAADSVHADMGVAKANLLEAEANAAEARGNADRARTLQDTGALSTQQINQYLTSAQTAQARVEAARAQVRVQEVRLQQTRVLAPDDGVISARSATVGAVSGSGNELFRLVRRGRLEWRAEVTASELGRLRVGTPALLTAASGAQVRGTVRMMPPTVDTQTRTALVYVDIPGLLARTGAAAAKAPEAAGSFLPGMFARGDFQLGNTPSLTVPQTAVVVRDGFSYVYVVGADNRVAQRKVQTGRTAGDRVEITAGVDASSRVVASGGGFLNEGDLVRVVAAAPASASAASTATPAPAASAEKPRMQAPAQPPASASR